MPNISANFSLSKAKWIHREERSEFEDADDERINRYSGQWMNRTFGYLTDGFFNSQEEIDNETVDQDQGGNVSIRPGDIRFVDYNGDGVITSRDQVVIGKGTTPESIFGLNASANYKGLDFSMLWQGAGGFVSIFNYDANIGGLFLGAGAPTTYQWEYQWNPDHPEKAKLPAPNINGVTSHNKRLNDNYVKNATYIRLKNISLGYSLPKSFLMGSGIEKCRIYVAASNLITFYNFGIFKDYDPESTEEYVSTRPGKIDTQENYPIQKVLSVGLNITL